MRVLRQFFLIKVGVDYSHLAVERSSELNENAIAQGRCEIIRASVSDLPFEDNLFDIATAFETVYFWQDFVNDLKEVARVLKDNGIIFIANEALPIEDDERQRHIRELLDMNIYSAEELESSLLEAGFGDVETHILKSRDSFTDDDANWICALARKI